jgi:hypothetical protein
VDACSSRADTANELVAGKRDARSRNRSGSSAFEATDTPPSPAGRCHHRRWNRHPACRCAGMDHCWHHLPRLQCMVIRCRAQSSIRRPVGSAVVPTLHQSLATRCSWWCHYNCACRSAYLWNGIADTESHYHGDESYWVPVGVRAFRTAFIECDPDHSFWFDSSLLFTSRHPQIGKYIIGTGAYLARYYDVPLFLYDFRQDKAWNKAHGRVLPSGIAGAARLPVALTGALCGAFLYWLGVQIAGPVTSILAVILFIATPVVWQHARLAMLDIPALMFGLLALNLCIRAVIALHAGATNAGVWIAACGATCGAAAGAKPNALLIPGICILALCLTGVTLPNRSGRHQLISGIVSLLLWIWVVFFLSNPMLYPYPVAGIQHMLELSKIVASGSRAPLPTLASRISAVWTSLGDSGYVGSSGLPGSRLWLIIGTISLARGLLQRPQGAPLSALSVIALWGITSFTGITLWIPLDVNRYYLPLVPIVALLQAYGIITISQNAFRLLLRFRTCS